MSAVDFSNFKAGKTVKADNYEAFLPKKINHEWQWSNVQLNALLEKASIAIGRLKELSRLAPNPDMYIHLLVQKEAVVSSRIEGIKTRMDEALMKAEDIDPERRDDWQEVQNYTRAMQHCLNRLNTLPLSTRLLREAHEILLAGVRGENKNPGEFRRSQNWIGGSTLQSARFVPPMHHEVPDLMSDLERFIHNDEVYVPALVRAAIAHYQFETIHPFLDGNGRIGRLLIVLYLVSVGVLDRPLLYLSVFFERDKMLYYDNLTRVRTRNEMTEWVIYFLEGVVQTANDSADTLTGMLELKTRSEQFIVDNFGNRASNGLKVLEQLFGQPVIQVKDIESCTGLTTASANNLLNLFINAGFLKQMGTRQRNRRFKFKPLLDMFDD